MNSDQQDSVEYFERNKFNKIEIDVYNGLKLLSSSIANLFADGVRIKNDEKISSKIQILGHLAREIDSSIRNIFAPATLKKNIQKNLDSSSLEQELKESKGHISSIIASLGDDPIILKEDFTAKWINVAIRFVTNAHKRHKDDKKIDQNEIVKIWDDYETILYRLFGNQLNILTRIDRILKIKEPHEDLISTLPNILKEVSVEFYFFKNLNHLTWFLPLKSISYFTPEHIYLGAQTIIDFIIKMARENINHENEKITDEFVEIVNQCVDYRISKISDQNPYIIDAAIFELCSYLPINKIPIHVIAILESSIKVEPNFNFVIISSMNNFIPYLLKNKNEDLYEAFIRVMLDFDVKDRSYQTYEAKINDSQLLDLISKGKDLIILNYSDITLKVVVEIINKILGGDPEAFNYWQVATIEDSSQLSFHDKYQVQLVQLIREILLVFNKNECEQIIIEWLKNKYSIFRRISIFLINKRYVEYKHHLWNMVTNPLDDEDCKHEVYQLFNEHAKDFNRSEVSKILSWIEKTNFDLPEDNSEEEKMKIIAYNKREWLSAISESKDVRVKKKIIKYNKIDDTRIIHPDHRIWHESTFGFKSPINISNLQEATVDEVVNELKTVNYANDSEALDNRGLNIQLVDLVKNNPKKYSEEIKKFDELPISFKSDIINGLTDAWKERKEFNWGTTIDFILNVIKENSFWEKHYGGGYNFRNSFIIYVCELFISGTRNDSNAFDKKYFNKVEEILTILDDKLTDAGYDFNDAATHYLNSTFGRFYDALLNFSLRYGRLHFESRRNLWPASIKQIFERRLNRKYEVSIDLSVCLGGFLPNFNFLDQQWVTKNINLIFPKENEQHWKAAMEGYLSFVRNYYKDIYILLRSNNHILKAINSNFDRQIAEKLFAHIFFAHINGLESIHDSESMISKIIESGKYKSTITHFLWTQRDNPKVNSEIILPIWERIFENTKLNLEDEENKRIISNLTQLLCYFETIPNELFDILTLSTKYLKGGFGTYLFVEELNRLKKKELKKVGILFLQLLNNDDFPTFKQEHIIEIVEELFTNNFKDVANDICNRYAKKNILFFRDLYEKYN